LRQTPADKPEACCKVRELLRDKMRPAAASFTCVRHTNLMYLMCRFHLLYVFAVRAIHVDDYKSNYLRKNAVGEAAGAAIKSLRQWPNYRAIWSVYYPPAGDSSRRTQEWLHFGILVSYQLQSMPTFGGMLDLLELFDLLLALLYVVRSESCASRCESGRHNLKITFSYAFKSCRR
jgi:hypothetical protein